LGAPQNKKARFKIHQFPPIFPTIQMECLIVVHDAVRPSTLPKIPAPRRNKKYQPSPHSTLLEHWYKTFGIIIQTEEIFLKSINPNASQQAQHFPSSIAATKELQVMGNE
jgi:2-C-methyl-D-erythritol 4-phosphate cytidylyltransferase